MPAEGASVTIVTSSSTAFMAVGQVVYVQFWGWMQVTAKPSTTQVTLLNLEDTAASEYTENAAPGTVLPAGAYIVPGGLQGPAGSITPGDYLESANNLSDVASAAASRTSLGLGTAATRAAGVANTNLPPVDTTFTSGDAVFATATGVRTQAAATARTSLGLGTMATQAANAVAITGGDIDGVAIGAGTADTGSFTTLASSGAATLNSAAITNNVSVGGAIFAPSTAIQSLLAATAINPNASKIRVVGNGGAVILVATPTITTPVADGLLLLIMGTDDTNTVTLQDETSLAGTKLRLNAGGDRTLGLYDTLLLAYDSTSGFWTEVAFSNN